MGSNQSVGSGKHKKMNRNEENMKMNRNEENMKMNRNDENY